MKFLSSQGQNLNDIIFAKRNKSYGAYAIRTSYNNSLLKALSIISSTIFLMTGCMYFLNKGQDDLSRMIINLPDNPVTKIFEVDNTPKTPKQEEKPKANPPSGQKTNALGSVVTDSLPDNKNTNTTNVTLVTNGTNTLEVSNPSINTATASGTGTTTTGGENTKPSLPFAIAQEMPEFEGGMGALLKFVAKNMVYPTLASQVGVEGTVYVSFVVDENGEVINAKVERGIGFGCDEESVRVVSKIPKFKKAGRNDGQAVKVRFNIPIKFVQAK